MASGKVAKFIEIPADLVAEVQGLCDRFGTTFTAEVVDALRRHVAYPPQRKPEPLSDAQKPAPRGRGRKGKAGSDPAG